MLPAGAVRRALRGGSGQTELPTRDVHQMRPPRGRWACDGRDGVTSRRTPPRRGTPMRVL